VSLFIDSNNLIIDLGMNNGDDTAYYLKKGYKVVAVEANSELCKKALKRFSEEIDNGTLQIVNAAIWKADGKQTFYINLENDHWSSLDIGWAGRDKSKYKETIVECITLPYLFELYGVPNYLKIDVEGVDEFVLQQLSEMDKLPLFVSVEDCRFGYKYMSILNQIGYDGFKILDQSAVSSLIDNAISHTFLEGSSGPLGNDIPVRWLSYQQMVKEYSTTVRDVSGNRIAPRTHWWDIHCTSLGN
jgi:FkbM family methyltransferase